MAILTNRNGESINPATEEKIEDLLDEVSSLVDGLDLCEALSETITIDSSVTIVSQLSSTIPSNMKVIMLYPHSTNDDPVYMATDSAASVDTQEVPDTGIIRRVSYDRATKIQVYSATSSKLDVYILTPRN